MPELLLHIGQTKTGTTTLQAFCAANRDWLAQRGVLYPHPPPAHPLRNQHRFLVDALHQHGNDFDGARPAWDHLHDAIAGSTAPRVLVSEEVFWHLFEGRPDRRPEALRWIGERLAPWKVTVWVTLRPQHRWIEAWYQQIVKTDVTPASAMDFAEFAAHCEAMGLMDYAARLDDWAQVFGPQAIQVSTFEPEARPGFDVVDDLLARLGLDGAGAVRPPNQQERLPLPAADLAHVFNRARRARDFKAPFMDALRPAGAVLGRDPRRLMAPDEVAALMARCADGNAALARRFLARDALFDAPLPLADEPVYPGLSAAELGTLAVHLFIEQQKHIRHLRQRLAALEARHGGGAAGTDSAHD